MGRVDEITYMLKRVSSLYPIVYSLAFKRIAGIESLIDPIIYRFSVLKHLAKRIDKIIDEANYMYLSGRASEIIEDYSIRGHIIWEKTLVNLLTTKLISQKVIVRTLNIPENFLLITITNGIIKELEDLEQTITALDNKNSPYRYIIDYIVKRIRRYKERLLNSIENSIFSILYTEEPLPITIDLIESLMLEIEIRPYNVEWVEELLDVSRIFIEYVKNLSRKEYRVMIRDILRDEGKSRRFWRVLTYRLYELYLLVLILEVLRKKGYKVGILRDRIFICENEESGEKYILLINRKPIDKYCSIRETIPPSIPDIIICKDRQVRLVFEAKYSRNPNYIGQAIFKVIAYSTLYNSVKTILVYPGLDIHISVNEDETRNIISYINMNDMDNVKYLRTKGGDKDLYLLIIKPLEKYEDTSKELLEKILFSM